MKTFVLWSSVLIITAMQPSPKAKKPASPPKYDLKLGKELITQSDCLTCHKETEKVIGPAYADVAKKYKPTEKNISMLADKVIAGGQGVWGPVPMIPHGTLSADDAKKMVAYILSIKSK